MYIGMPPPPRPSKKGAIPKSLFLPTSTVMAIQAGAPVLIGGAPTIVMPGPADLLSPGAKLLKKTLMKAQRGRRLLAGASRKLRGSSRYLNQVAGKVFDNFGVAKSSGARNAVSRGICAVTGHPVDIATGKVFTDFVDLELPGPLRLKGVDPAAAAGAPRDAPVGDARAASRC